MVFDAGHTFTLQGDGGFQNVSSSFGVYLMWTNCSSGVILFSRVARLVVEGLFCSVRSSRVGDKFRNELNARQCGFDDEKRTGRQEK